MIIYKIENKINHKKYIGSTKKTLEQRYKRHLRTLRAGNHNPKFQEDFDKYGEDAFTVSVLANLKSEHELIEKEKYYIKKYNSIEDGYNYSTYSSRGKNTNPDEEVIYKLSQSIKNSWSRGSRFSLASIQNISNSQKERRLFNHENSDNIKNSVQDFWNNISQEEREYRGKKVSYNYYLKNPKDTSQFYEEETWFLNDILEIEKKEIERQNNEIQLIASENYYSDNVRYALSSVLGYRYGEGYPNFGLKDGDFRYYAGQDNIDKIETFCIEQAKKVFHADHANVQPNSGVCMNEYVYFAWANPGDTIMAMDISMGHLSHVSPISNLAKVFKPIYYGVDENEIINYKEIEEKIIKYKPRILVIGYSAYTRMPDFGRIATFVKENSPNTLLMADMSHVAGLIAAGFYDNPLDKGFHVMTTTTHKTLGGNRGGLILSNGVVSSPLKKPEHTLENIPTLIDRSVFPSGAGGAHFNEVMAKAITLCEAQTFGFKVNAEKIMIYAKIMEEKFKKMGYRLISNGTDSHMIVIDCLESLNMTGGEAEKKLQNFGIIVNKNAIPNDKGSKFNPSGIRIGTPCITKRGFNRGDVSLLCSIIDSILRDTDSKDIIVDNIKLLTDKYPVFQF